MIARWAFCALAWLVVSTPRAAHAYGEPLGVLLEPTYALPVPLFAQGGESPVDFTHTLLPYTLEASIALHVPLTSSFAELETRDGWAHSFVFIPRIDLRHGLGTSFPIRTPSYYPTVRFQVFRQDHPQPWHRRRLVLELFVAHLSNGQDGCFYRDQVDPPNGRCRFPGGGTRVHAPLNHEDGSFANNELGFRVGLDDSFRAAADALGVTFMLGFAVFRPKAGGIDAEIERLYGWGRTEAHFRIAKHVLDGRRASSDIGLRSRLDVRVGGQDVENRAGLLLDGFWRFRVMRDWGPFARVYHGYDYYNIRFDVRVTILGLGMMWEP